MDNFLSTENMGLINDNPIINVLDLYYKSNNNSFKIKPAKQHENVAVSNEEQIIEEQPSDKPNDKFKDVLRASVLVIGVGALVYWHHKDSQVKIIQIEKNAEVRIAQMQYDSINRHEEQITARLENGLAALGHFVNHFSFWNR